MQRKQYIKPIANPKPLFFENLLAGVSPPVITPGQPGSGNMNNRGENDDQGARSRYDIDWFGSDKNSSFDF